MTLVAPNKIVFQRAYMETVPNADFTYHQTSPLFQPAAKHLERSFKTIEKEMNTMEQNENSPITDLASELGVEIEALEERLEMVGIEALACCSINLFCRPSLQ